MKEQIFSEAMGKLSDKYITEAISYNAKNKQKKLGVILRKYAAVACLFVVFGFGMLISVNTQVRAAVFGWVREFSGGNHYKYIFNGNVDKTTIEVKETLKYYPRWLPEGTEYVTTIEEVGGEIIIYTNKRDALIRFSYSMDPKSATYIDGVDYIQKHITVNNCDGTIYLAPSEGLTNAIVWTDDSVPVIFFFAADCSEEDLIKVAENVEIIEEVKED